MKTKLELAISLRQDNKPQEAYDLLQALLKESPNDPQLNYQIAWTCDFMGHESEAVPYYEKSIANGLAGQDRQGALLGLGSTYRCLGEYEKSHKIFEQAVREFPNQRVLYVFHALTLFNLGKSEKSVELLLTQLLETTEDKSILSYEKALRFYSDKLTQIWI